MSGKYQITTKTGETVFRLHLQFDGQPRTFTLSQALYDAIKNDSRLVITPYIDPPPSLQIIVSKDAGNTARLGTDGGIFVPASTSTAVNIDAIDAALGQKVGDLVGLLESIVKPFPQTLIL